MKKQLGISERDLEVQESPEVKSLKSEVRTLREQFRSYKEEHGLISNLIGDVVQAVHAIQPVEVKPYTPVTKVESPCAVVMQLTDQHYGRVQDASEIEGFCEYDPDISRRFQLNFAKEVLDWVEVKRAAYKFDELRMIYTGDGISGDIHDELRVTNAFPAPVQAVGEAKIIAEQAMILAPYFKSVVIDIIGEDNHGRLTKKPQSAQGGLNNWNTVIAAIVKSMLQSQSNITVNWHPVYETVIPIKGRRYLCSHGHNLRGWMGIPFYAVERQTGKEAMKRINAPVSTHFHKLIIGHFHAPFDGLTYGIGGSCSGTDAFDHKNGRHAPATQTAWLIHPKHGEFDRTNFMLS